MTLVYLCRHCPLICDAIVALEFNGKCPRCKKRLVTTPYCEERDLDPEERECLVTQERLRASFKP